MKTFFIIIALIAAVMLGNCAEHFANDHTEQVTEDTNWARANITPPANN
jgi:hypothetical protein